MERGRDEMTRPTIQEKLNFPRSTGSSTAVPENLYSHIEKIGHGMGYDAISWGAVGNGSTDDHSAIQDMIDAIVAGGTNEAIVFSTGTYKIEATMSIPAVVSLSFQDGAMLQIEAGYTVTILGNFSGMNQLFSGAGTVSFTGNHHIKEVYPEWWGAVADGTTDDKVAIQSAADAAWTCQGMLYLKNGDGYAISGTVTIPVLIDMDQNAPIYYSGSANEAALIINGTSVPVRLTGLHVVRNTLSWASESTIGIQIVGVFRSHIEIVYVQGFTIGVQFKSTNLNRPIGWNSIYFGEVASCKYSVDIVSTETGWCNENIFYNVTCETRTVTGLPTTTSIYGIRLTSTGGGYANNNVFYKPCFELGSHEDNPETVCIVGEYAGNNSFFNVRDEIYHVHPHYLARISNASKCNYFSVTSLATYGSPGIIQELGTHPSSIYEETLFTKNTPCKVIFDSGPLHKIAVQYDDGTDVWTNIPGLSYRYYYTTKAQAENPLYYYSYGKGATIYDDHLSLGVGADAWYIPGRFVDTTNNRQLVVRRNLHDGTGGYITLLCYDSSGNIVTTAGKVTTDGFTGINPPPVDTWVPTSPTYFGGRWLSGAAMATDIFYLSSDIVKVWVGVGQCELISFTIEIPNTSTMLGSPATWSGMEDVITGANTLPSAPNYWKYERGRIVFNSSPTTGSTLGWRCIQRLNTTVKTTVSSGTSLALNLDTVNLLANDVVGIILDSGSIHWTHINTISTSDTVVVHDAIPSSATAGNVVYTNRWEDLEHTGLSSLQVAGVTTLTGELHHDGDFNHDGTNVGFYGGTPVALGAALTGTLTTVTCNAPGTTDYAIADPVQNTGFGFSTSDEMLSVLKVIANMQTRINQLENRLSTTGVKLFT
jgi:hypothetical protein